MDTLGGRLTTGQAAKVCQVAPRTITKWFDKGILPGYRVGLKDRRIPRKFFIRFIKKYGMDCPEAIITILFLVAVKSDRQEELVQRTQDFLISGDHDLLPDEDQFERVDDLFQMACRFAQLPRCGVSIIVPSGQVLEKGEAHQLCRSADKPLPLVEVQSPAEGDRILFVPPPPIHSGYAGGAREDRSLPADERFDHAIWEAQIFDLPSVV